MAIRPVRLVTGFIICSKCKKTEGFFCTSNLSEAKAVCDCGNTIELTDLDANALFAMTIKEFAVTFEELPIFTINSDGEAEYSLGRDFTYETRTRFQTNDNIEYPSGDRTRDAIN